MVMRLWLCVIRYIGNDKNNIGFSKFKNAAFSNAYNSFFFKKAKRRKIFFKKFPTFCLLDLHCLVNPTSYQLSWDFQKESTDRAIIFN